MYLGRYRYWRQSTRRTKRKEMGRVTGFVIVLALALCHVSLANTDLEVSRRFNLVCVFVMSSLPIETNTIGLSCDLINGPRILVSDTPTHTHTHQHTLFSLRSRPPSPSYFASLRLDVCVCVCKIGRNDAKKDGPLKKTLKMFQKKCYIQRWSNTRARSVPTSQPRRDRDFSVVTSFAHADR